MDRVFSIQRNDAGHAIMAPQTYIADTSGVIELVSGTPVVIPSTMGAMSVTIYRAYIDAPAPRSRCIVLGARDNRIIL